MATSAQEMLLALHQGGMKDAQIAEEVGVSQPTINRIRNGEHVEPKHSTWEAINTLYLRKQAEAARNSAANDPQESGAA